MSDERYKTLRHMETVRNYLNAVIVELLHRGEQHDQSKLQDPERAEFDKWTPLLKASTYGTDEYEAMRAGLKPALDHHYAHNRHHPEHDPRGIDGMNLIDLIEMFCDWKASTLRHEDGDIYKSIPINADRFLMSLQLKHIFENTADWIESLEVFHHAEESS